MDGEAGPGVEGQIRKRQQDSALEQMQQREDGVEGEQGREGVDGGVLEGLVGGEEGEGDGQEQAAGSATLEWSWENAYDMNSAIMAT